MFTGGGNGKNKDFLNTVRGKFQIRNPQEELRSPAGTNHLGLNSRRPVILDNDAFSDDWTLASASEGRLDLRGIIGCKAGRDGQTIYLTADQACAEIEHLIGLRAELG